MTTAAPTKRGQPKGKPNPPLFDRPLPHSVEAEAALLSAVLLDNRTLPEILEVLVPEDFYRQAHALIFSAMTTLFDKNEPVDLVTVYSRLEAEGQLERCGGAGCLARLVDAAPAAVNAAHYARIVHDKALIRGLIAAGYEIAARCLDGGGDVDTLIDHSESALFDVTHRRIRSAFTAIGRINAANVEKIRYWHDHKSLVRGIPTGFGTFDRLTHGLQGSDLVILAARPAMGKTALALNMARNVAVNAGIPVAVFSLEMAKEQLSLRLLCADARLNAGLVRDGFMSREDWERLQRATKRLAAAPLMIDDSAELTVTQIRAKARRLQMERGLGLAVVDYLQLIKSPVHLDRRDLEISEISRSLKALAKELNIPVIALSQLNRELEKRSNKRPRLSDLRESGSLEQDADLVVFIHREEVYQDPPAPGTEGLAELILAKHRNGPTGVVKLAFLKAFTRFENMISKTSPEADRK
jgi:replicative DNA helicase